MLDEARALHTAGLSYDRMDELGLEYRYMARHLQGLMTHDEMCTVLASEIYKYAKRQMTWFKRNTDIQWFDASNPTLLEEVLEAVHQ
jgi:tRNA dimethylallyltransferase